MPLRAALRGVFPVAPTTFDERGGLDLDSQRRCIDFLIDAGSNGICILANYSEQFALADDEREALMQAVLKHVAGRLPVIVTTTHFSSKICVERSRRGAPPGRGRAALLPMRSAPSSTPSRPAAATAPSPARSAGCHSSITRTGNAACSPARR